MRSHGPAAAKRDEHVAMTDVGCVGVRARALPRAARPPAREARPAPRRDADRWRAESDVRRPERDTHTEVASGGASAELGGGGAETRDASRLACRKCGSCFKNESRIRPAATTSQDAWGWSLDMPCIEIRGERLAECGRGYSI